MGTGYFIATGVFPVELLANQVSMVFLQIGQESSDHFNVYPLSLLLALVYNIISHLICIFEIFSNLVLRVSLSASLQLVIGRKTLIAAGHVTTQNLGGKKNC